MESVSVASEIRLEEYITDVSIQNLASTWLPMPFPAVGVTGLDGDWSTVADNRTVISDGGRGPVAQ